MNDADLLSRLVSLERRNGLLLLLVLGLSCGVAFLVFEYGRNELGLKHLKTRTISLRDEHGVLEIRSNYMLMSESSNQTALSLSPDRIELSHSAGVDLKSLKPEDWWYPPGSQSITIRLLDNQQKPLPQIEIAGAKRGFPRTTIGCARLFAALPDGKKTETEYPESSIIFFDENGISKKVLP